MAIARNTDGIERILSLSYGKDSIACLGAIEELDWPLDRIITVDVWADDGIPGDLPEMVEFKPIADAKIKELYGIEVEHLRTNVTFVDMFYKKYTDETSQHCGEIYGWPRVQGGWCVDALKFDALSQILDYKKLTVQYLGIAPNEPKRFKVLGIRKKSPLIAAGWDEKKCYEWCEERGLLSPAYKNSFRSGCWFCPNQSDNSLRYLRKNYPEYWAMMLKWEEDSPRQFDSHNHSLFDFEKRFVLEDKGLIDPTKKFYWSWLDGVTV